MIIKNVFNYYIFNVSEGNSSDVYFQPVIIDEIKLYAVCDTGTPYTLITLSFYAENNIKKKLRSCTVQYVDYNGDKLKLVGEFVQNLSLLLLPIPQIHLYLVDRFYLHLILNLLKLIT